MNRELIVIELGTASIETRGSIGAKQDGVLLQPQTMLTDD